MGAAYTIGIHISAAYGVSVVCPICWFPAVANSGNAGRTDARPRKNAFGGGFVFGCACAGRLRIDSARPAEGGAITASGHHISPASYVDNRGRIGRHSSNPACSGVLGNRQLL